MKTGVYKIVNLVNGDCYVGSCSHKTGIKHRWRNHVNSLKKGNHHSIIFQRAWNKYGEANFNFEILEKCSPEKCIKREQHYFDILHPKYNILRVAGSSRGRKLSPKHIQKLKERSYDWMKGDKNWNKSPEKREFYRQRMIRHPIRINEEGKQKVSIYQRGRPKSEIHKKRIGEALTGVPKSLEHIEKMSKAKKEWAQKYNSGKNNYFHIHKRLFAGENNPRFSGYYKFRNLVTKEELIVSKKELSERYGLNHSKVCAICNGKRKSIHKWICLGKEENNA